MWVKHDKERVSSVVGESSQEGACEGTLTSS